MKSNSSPKISFLRYLLFACTLAIVLVSCSQEKKSKVQKITAKTLDRESSLQDVHPQLNLNIYSLEVVESGPRGPLAFISFSESYQLSESPDSSAVPEKFLGNIDFEGLGYVTLKGKFRKRFLNGSNLNESDSLYLYNFSIPALSAFKISELEAIAFPNYYMSNGDSIRQEDYMIGFKVDTLALKGYGGIYHNYFLACVGNQNPFSSTGLQPIIWKKTQFANIPQHKCSARSQHNPLKFKASPVYTFGGADAIYYAQEFSGDHGIVMRHIVVFDEKTKKILLDHTDEEEEGYEVPSLNSYGEQWSYLWTGKLFKQTRPVFLDFNYPAFGCPDIKILDGKKTYVQILCDNRH